MKKHLYVFLVIIILLIPVLTIPASADVGPKPSVTVNIKGLEQEDYYITLLSKTDSTGPWDVNNEYDSNNVSEKIWDKFKNYKDEDGYYFIGYISDCSENDTFIWSYYPPDDFKILIYFPQTDKFIISEKAYDKYAFDSYYTFEATELKIYKNYDYFGEAISLCCRIVLTLIIELAVAWLFFYRSKKQVLIILITNIATQTILNILLNIIRLKQGDIMYVINYIWMEAVIIIIEGIVYQKLLCRYEENSERKTHPWLYSLSANLLSVICGFVIAIILPGIF